jgi:chromosome partitioning protein
MTYVLRRVGLQVLPVDLDPQGNLSDYFDVERDAFPTVREVLLGQARAADAIHAGMIPANLSLAEAELSLGGRIGRELALKRALSEVESEFDVILIDCPPTLGLLTVNALVASSHALISAEPEYFSLRGVDQVLEVMKLTRDWLNNGLEWLGVAVNIADMSTLHARKSWERLSALLGPKLFGSVIRKSIRYPESAQRGVSILDHGPQLGRDYLRLTNELLARLGEEETRERLGALEAELAHAEAETASPETKEAA